MTPSRLFNAGFLAGTLALSGAAAAMPDFSFNTDELPDDGDVVVYVTAGGGLGDLGRELDEATGGRLSGAIEVMEFSGEFGETLTLPAVAPFRQVVVIGAGDEALGTRDLHDLGGHAAMAADDEDGLAIVFDALDAAVDAAGAHLALGYALGDYRFTTYKTVDDIRDDGEVVLVGSGRADQRAFETDLGHLAEGITLARNLGSEPGNTLWPQRFVEHVQAAFEDVDDVTITVLDADDIRARGMGALMGVGQGSIHDPRLLVVQYRGSDDAPIALAGKGITFDTGGISIKPNENMWYMKSDLSGAAAVAGAVLAAAKREENVHVVGVMPLAENMPSQDAIRPGDVLTTMSGKTVEIMSTDAEGRLLLVDAVYYAQQEFEPRMLLNIATLTGSAARATGAEYAAVITRDLPLSLEMMEVGEASGEDVWPLPLHPNHFTQIESLIADIKNTGGSPGASIGAAVIGINVAEDLPWVHLDIAGVDWRDEATPTAPVGHAGWGVRFMDELLRREADQAQ
ncbi:leucyl aminopeptidase family protein [Wenzhouxiangella sp. XN79A]|uniref:leucyl aminopeptidase family protein n=1 Tax=Wenzhouxiangella sp. XN79A TaxID=2724193 RepID=UPI00144A50D0|nr:leucyl aminopeptidase family protein [Wenzhouxiangella sp. XN79A]NKI34193.1 leucyl aminopeptidase family protein [Wenzhouxiangella sp. XN79A]